MEYVKYKIIYAFEVMDKITEGKQVMMLDREKRAVYSVNELTVSEFGHVLSQTDTGGRFEYWYEEKEEQTAEAV